MVRAWCASGESAPTLIADTTNRRAMDARVLDLVERSGRGERRDPELVARHGRRAGVAGEGRAIAREGRVDRRRAPVAGLAVERPGQDLDLLGDRRREEMRLAIGPEPREARIGQPRLAAGRRRRQGQAAAATAERPARPGRRASSGRATRRRSGSSGR